MIYIKGENKKYRVKKILKQLLIKKQGIKNKWRSIHLKLIKKKFISQSKDNVC